MSQLVESSSTSISSNMSSTSSVGFDGIIFLHILDAQQKKKDIAEHQGDIFYSKRYSDDLYEYRHVIVPKALTKYYPSDRLLLEHEWRSLGIQQSPGWTHYMIHKPEPHILLFRRDKTQPSEMDK